jgi:hypothetical protein
VIGKGLKKWRDNRKEEGGERREDVVEWSE